MEETEPAVNTPSGKDITSDEKVSRKENAIMDVVNNGKTVNNEENENEGPCLERSDKESLAKGMLSVREENERPCSQRSDKESLREENERPCSERSDKESLAKETLSVREENDNESKEEEEMDIDLKETKETGDFMGNTSKNKSEVENNEKENKRGTDEDESMDIDKTEMKETGDFKDNININKETEAGNSKVEAARNVENKEEEMERKECVDFMGNSTKSMNENGALDSPITEKTESGNQNEIKTSTTTEKTQEITTDFPDSLEEKSTEYELISGHYYYSDPSTGSRYRFDNEKQEWVDVVSSTSRDSSRNEDKQGDVPIEMHNKEMDAQTKTQKSTETQAETESQGQFSKPAEESKSENDDADSEKGDEREGNGNNYGSVTTDEEGRTYYYADNHYLCQDPSGNVFYFHDNEWKPWTEETKESTASNASKWFFYQDDSTFYRDNSTGVIFRFNKEKNDWEKYDGKLRKKRALVDDEEEFDTEDESDEEGGGGGGGLVPPGAKEDPNIRYDGSTYTKVDPSDNMIYEWDTHRRAWFPKLDDDFMATYQLSYGFNPDGTKNENPLKFDDDEEEEEERKAAEEKKKKQEKEDAKATKKKPTWFEADETRNNKVYVSNLPDTVTEDIFVALMQKCGMVLIDDKTNRPKVKLYRDSDGHFKGDALCTYIKVESVELAEQILDGYHYGNNTLKVERAKFELKGHYNPKLKPRKRGKKELERLQKKQEKLFDWRPEPMRGQRKKHENSVVIRNVFDPKEFEVAMDKILDHKEAMRNQASNFGKVKKIELFDLHPEGVVQVTFDEIESADMCVVTLNKRLYCGRTLYVTTWDGKEKFRIEETAAEREERIKKWNEFLEAEAAGTKKT